MKDISKAFTFDLTNLDHSAWLERLDETSEEFGHAEPIGLNHMALFIDAGTTLLVSFESAESIRSNDNASAPFGWSFVKSHGWSSLTMMAPDDEDWFRHPTIFGYFDRLIDDGFFDDFDSVLFYGAGPAGYAAAAFSVAAPDARVLAIQPQATLDTKLARWDTRYPEARRLDFTSRFGYAPMMVETAPQVSVIHDPTVIEDAVHAALFNGANTRHFACPNLGPNADKALMAMGILPALIKQAMLGTLDTQSFAAQWRERHKYMPYLRTLHARLHAKDTHPRLLARLCRAAIADRNRPMFAKTLARLEEQGVTL